jgi:hypothetical protein
MRGMLRNRRSSLELFYELNYSRRLGCKLSVNTMGLCKKCARSAVGYSPITNCTSSIIRVGMVLSV